MSIIQRLKIKMCDLPVQLATGIRSWCTARKDSLKQTHHNHPWIWRAAKWIVGIIVFGAICTMYYSERNARIAERGNDIAEAALQVSIQSKNLVAEQMFKDGVRFCPRLSWHESVLTAAVGLVRRKVSSIYRSPGIAQCAYFYGSCVCKDE